MQVNYILIADDDPEDSEFFTEVVSVIDPNIQVSVAGSREQLFERLDHSLPDLLFMDSFIRQDSGLDSIREIKKRISLQNIPVIMYTGSGDQVNISQAFQAGASAYIVKPDTFEGIREVLQQVLVHDWKAAAAGRFCYIDGKTSDFDPKE